MIRYDPNFLGSGEADRLFDSLRKGVSWEERAVRVYGRWIKQPRLVAWYGPRPYTYSGLTIHPQEWTSDLLALRSRLSVGLGVDFNSVFLNLYRSGSDSIGWHSDNEPGVGPVIASVSLGVCRKFSMRHRGTGLREDYYLSHGSLLVMGAGVQDTWEHSVPKTVRGGERINLTFRTFT